MKQWLAFWALGLIWGSSFLLIKIAVDELHPLPLVSVRLGIAASLMLSYLVVTGRRLPSRRVDLAGLVFVGLMNVALPFTLITAAEQSIDSSLATILNSSVPLFSLIIAHFAIADESLTYRKSAGLLIGYVGIIVLTWRGLQQGGDNSVQGILMMLAATMCYAIAVVYIRARLRHIDPLTVAGSTLIIAALVIFPITFLVEGSLPNPASLSTRTLLVLLMLGSVNTVVAYFLFYDLIDKWGARATMVTYLFPPVGIVLGAVFLDEPIDARLILGALLILGGVVAVNYRPRRLRLHRRSDQNKEAVATATASQD